MPEAVLAGHRIAYREAGRGPLVIALHCSSSHSGQWKPVIEALSDRYRVIAPDLLGYGRSGPLPRDGRPFFVHDADWLGALVAREGPAHLVGHSLGGATAFAAVTRGMRARSLLMIEPVLFDTLVEAGHGEAGDQEPVHDLIRRGLAAGDPGRAARDFIGFWSGPGAFDAMEPATRAYVVETIGRVDADFEGIRTAPGLAEAAALDLPVTLFCGTATRPAAKGIVALLAAAIPGARRVDLPGAAHMAAVTQPELIISPIAAHLDAQPRQEE